MTGINLGGSSVSVTPPPTGVLYGAQGGVETTSDLYTIDPDTGAGTSVGASGFALTGMAMRPSDNMMFAVTSANSAANPRSLITVDTVTGAGTLVGSLGIANPIADISFRSDDTLYGYRASTRTLHTIDTTTGAATQVSATAVPSPTVGFGLAFDPSDVLYVFPKGDDGIYYIVDETTGALTAQPTLTGLHITNGSVAAASFNPNGTLWVGDIGSPSQYLATIDLGTSVITGVGVTIAYPDALAWGI